MARAKLKTEPPIIEVETPRGVVWRQLLVSLFVGALIGLLIAIFFFYREPIYNFFKKGDLQQVTDQTSNKDSEIVPSPANDTPLPATQNPIDDSEVTQSEIKSELNDQAPPSVETPTASDAAPRASTQEKTPVGEDGFEGSVPYSNMEQRDKGDVALILRAGGPLERVWSDLENQIASETLEILYPAKHTRLEGRDGLMVTAYMWWQSLPETDDVIETGMPGPVDAIANQLIKKTRGRSPAQEAFYQATAAGDIALALTRMAQLSKRDQTDLETWHQNAMLYLALKDAQEQWDMGD